MKKRYVIGLLFVSSILASCYWYWKPDPRVLAWRAAHWDSIDVYVLNFKDTNIELSLGNDPIVIEPLDFEYQSLHEIYQLGGTRNQELPVIYYWYSKDEILNYTTIPFADKLKDMESHFTLSSRNRDSIDSLQISHDGQELYNIEVDMDRSNRIAVYICSYYFDEHKFPKGITGYPYVDSFEKNDNIPLRGEVGEYLIVEWEKTEGMVVKPEHMNVPEYRFGDLVNPRLYIVIPPNS